MTDAGRTEAGPEARDAARGLLDGCHLLKCACSFEREDEECIAMREELAAALARPAAPEDDAGRALIDAARKVVEGFDIRVFGRDTTRDHESGWAVRALPYLVALGNLIRLVEAGADRATPGPEGAATPDGPDGETRRNAGGRERARLPRAVRGHVDA